MRDRKLIRLLASALYYVVEKSVSVDVAFKRACAGRCAKTLEERERLYEMVRRFVSDYWKLVCVLGRRKRYGTLARAWLSGVNEPKEPHCRLSYPRWFYERVTELLGKEEGERMLEAMNRRTWWLRVNTLAADVDKVVRELESEGVDVEQDRHIPYMLRVLRTPKPVRLLKPVKQYRAIPQDKASAAVVEALKPEPGDVVVDMAAAPGMKTSLIMMLTENRARVVAIDISVKRLVQAANLLKKLGTDMGRVQLVAADSAARPITERADKVLLDAPCSNSGAVGKDPGIKVNLTEGKVAHYSRLQREMLIAAYDIEPHYVVFSTCSVMPEEGEEHAESLSQLYNPEKPLPWLRDGYRVYSVAGSVGRMYPHLDSTDGFFIARLRPQ